MSALILLFIRKRRAKAIRVAAIVDVVLAIRTPVPLLLSLVVVILAFRKSLTDYCSSLTSSSGDSRLGVSEPL